jgi:type III restriction enzyme
MADDKFLEEYLPEKLREYRIPYSTIPAFITDNLRWTLFDWQQKALLNFLDYLEVKEIENPNDPSHLLFNLATGTGKTLIMAATILYYYEKGYRHFLFFVNQNNIVGKTEDNLIDPDHNKYLFSNPIVIDKKTVNIKNVETFSEESDNIEILFTSIHKLHNAVYKIQENSIFLEDLQKRDLVMLADEAHHLNAATKAKEGEQLDLEMIGQLADHASAKDVEKSWEHTINDLLLHRGNRSNSSENKNVLLEFTATVPDHKNVQDKYLDKTLIRFELKDFLKAGYTKEINLVSSSFDKRLRVLQALLFNWYRYEIGVKYKLPNFKPVMLFRSKFVTSEREENVAADYELFRDIIDNLTIRDFDFLKTIEKTEAKEVYELGQSRIVDIRNYIDTSENVNLNTVITYLKDAFRDTNCIITHSENKEASGRRGEDKTTPEQDKQLNSLEDKNNPITAIFTCQRLTEGWDVLNLFDIVRMYEGQNKGGQNKGKVGGSTTSEVQLIGRGVRYYPFNYEDHIPIKRKFDKKLDHELRVLEEFYFHSDDNIKYIGELKTALRKAELLPEEEKQLRIFDIKPEIKNDSNSFYNTLSIFKNERANNPNKRKRNLKELRKDWYFNQDITPAMLKEETINLQGYDEDKTRYESKGSSSGTITIKLKEAPRHTLFKALNIQTKKEKSILRFENLKEELSIGSFDDALTDDHFGSFEISVTVPKTIDLKGANDKEKFASIEPREQVRILNNAFEQLESELQLISNPYIGTDLEAVAINEYFNEPKPIYVVKNDESDAIQERLLKKDWYPLTAVYGTSEERELVKFLESKIENFKEVYDDVNLLRNEEVYKIRDFKTGRGFMPDFLLFLKSKWVFRRDHATDFGQTVPL